ncbi:MAG: hypothetical protein DRQ57_09360 [Gammaproteobacteria bacterium]|nr:MAG: hypothetical protein DRQ57_09360 [Gammaproteobacteria bacterium]
MTNTVSPYDSSGKEKNAHINSESDDNSSSNRLDSENSTEKVNGGPVQTQLSKNDVSQSAKKKSPADAFLDLKDVVNVMRAELYDLKDYSSALIELSAQHKNSYKEEGRREGIDSLSRIHQLLFRKVASMDMGKEDNNSYIRQLYDNVEGELKGLGVSVIFPNISDIPDYEYMVTVGSVKSSIMRKPNTISKVEACGYCIENGDKIKVLRKAEIVMYRKGNEVR